MFAPTAHCSVSWLERCISDANLRQPNYFLICRLSKTKEGHLAKGIHPLRDGTVRGNFQKYIAPMCGDNSSKNYGLHSLRSGGASTAINNGVSERLVGKHGRWKSGYTRDRYLKDSENGVYLSPRCWVCER